MSKIDLLRGIIKRKPYLIWYTKEYNGLSLGVVAEAIFNYGNWEDFKFAEKVLGVKELARVFNHLSGQKRCNLHPMVKNYFSIYFDKYA